MQDILLDFKARIDRALIENDGVGCLADLARDASVVLADGASAPRTTAGEFGRIIIARKVRNG